MLELVPTGATFLAATMVTHLAGPVALGHAEAARIVAQPLLVIAMGLSAVLGPRSLEAGAARDREEARRFSRPFTFLLGCAGLAYSAVTITAWWGNPLGALIPKAYAVPGLVTATVLAHVATGMGYPFRAELLGARRLQRLPQMAMIAGLLQCAVAGLAAWLGAFARPVSTTVGSVTLWLGYWRYRRMVYTSVPARE